MNPETRQEEALFYAALKLTDPGQRGRFLDNACAGDPQLRANVEELLSSINAAEQFFAEGGSALARPTGDIQSPRSGAGDAVEMALPAEEQPGTRVGRYKLLQKVGEGGCGVVYMAEQEEPVRRRVALKVIKLGMDTKSVIARFEAERQALAMMDHPNIARVLDAGATETGRPYFVMELVRGIRITDYCDQNHLDTRQRLDLFIQICHAIQHAHQKGIIHRDIKPSNILVTLNDPDKSGVPKVIDFGIAKATQGRLTDRTLFTAYEQFVGTPAYMSPEQAEMSGLDVDTRSDIYSLGVLLYELLTSKTPFDGTKLLQSGLDGIRRTLREREPQRPSTMLTTLQGPELRTTAEQRHSEVPKLVSLLKGDLDWIVMKALEKDRRRRYETANGLAMDIERYLNNEPVAARPPSRLYRFQKLVERNRVIVTAAAAVVIALAAGMGTSTWLFLKEREARQRAVAAEQQESRLRQKAELREKVTRAIMLASQDKLDQADRLIDNVHLDWPTLEGAAVLRSVGEWHAFRGEWKLAVDRFNALLQVDQLDGWDIATLDVLACGAALAELEDARDYNMFRWEVVHRFVGTTNPIVAERIVKICALLPCDPEVIDRLGPLKLVAANRFAGVDEQDNVFRTAWQSMSLAMLEYRQGNYAQARDACLRCLAYEDHTPPRLATTHVLLAMCYSRLDKPGQARTELARGRTPIENKFKNTLDYGSREQGFWFDWIFARVLLREATGMTGSVPDISDSSTRPGQTSAASAQIP